MSSFTHHLEDIILETHIAASMYIGLSRNDGNRQGDFATWSDVSDPGESEKWEADSDGIDEPGSGQRKVWDPEEGEDGEWVTETVTNYARQSLSGTDWYAVTVVGGDEGDSEIRLSSTIEFPELDAAGENWGTISHFFLADGASAGSGNILAWGQMPDSHEFTQGMTPKIWANTIVVRMTD